LAASGTAIALTPLVPVRSIGQSLSRLLTVNTSSTVVTIEPESERETIELPLRPQELETITFDTDQPITIRTQKPIEGFALLKVPNIDLDQESPWSWEKSAGKPNPFLGKKAQIEATNLNSKKNAQAAHLTINWRLVPEFPEVAILPITTATLLIIVLLYSLFRLSIRRVAAVVSATMKEAIGQPIFTVAIVAGIVLLLTFIVIPYNTFGEDVKMLKDSGLTLVKILALLVVIWTASVTVSDEIEGRTALTVLSKPLTRRQFIIGKFIGLSLVALLIFMVLGAVLMSSTSLKVVYDARESSKTAPLWADCATEMVTVVPGLVLSLLETILLAAVSLAVSTRVGMIPNLIICFTIYVLGHLVPLIVQSSVGKLAIVRFVGRLFATLLPVLEHFTIEAAVIGGVPVPWGYLAWAAVYAGLYSAIALLIALVLFQNRDLA
jgi:ABC-type transport system involved in multi-copper enzyme maturation permease subunit